MLIMLVCWLCKCDFLNYLDHGNVVQMDVTFYHIQIHKVLNESHVLKTWLLIQYTSMGWFKTWLSFNIHQWDETLQLLTLWLVLCALEEALNQYILQFYFLTTSICGHVNATFVGETHLLLISIEINCSCVFDTFLKPKCFAFFIVNHGCIVINDRNFLFSHIFYALLIHWNMWH